jgi:arylsulfatase A-like enzyme
VALAALLLMGVAALGSVGLRIARSPGATLELASGAITGYNVLLVTLDTLRSDRVGCYGYKGVETPALDALAAGGVRFANVVSPVPMTLPAHASILTGGYPSRHGVRDNGTYRLTDTHETLAERLKAQGYVTAAFIGAFVLDHRYGTAQGFDTYQDEFAPGSEGSRHQQLNPERRADEVVDSALAWFDGQRVARSGHPYFVWVHLFDPHAPYMPPEPYRTRYARDPYDGEVAWTDHQVGRLLEALRARGALDRTLVVAVGDHGEGLGDHGESTHSLLIYESAMSVPLLLYAPQSITRPVVVADRVVSLVDIVPTILDGLGLPAGGYDGVSLLRDAPENRVLYMETLAPQLNHGWSALYGVRRGQLKYIQAPTPELYDLNADPREARNLASARPEDAATLADELALIANSMPESAAAAVIEVDTEARRKLEALGYLGPGAASTDAQATGPPPDPKVMIGRFDADLRRASGLIAARRAEEAIPLVQSLLARSPGDVSLWSLLSAAQAQAARPQEAIASRQRALTLQPNDAGSWVQLATLQEATGDLAGSAASLTEAERLEPELGSVCIVRAMQALHARRYNEALEWAQEARRRDPTRFTSDSLVVEGRVREAIDRPDEE